VTVDGKNRGRFVQAVWVELSNIDAKELLNIGVSATNGWDQRVVDRVELGRQQQVIMPLYLSEATIDYLVRIEGAIDFKQPPK
jgi:hypothetical protein